MTLVLRRLDAPIVLSLGGAGLCRVSLCEIVGLFGHGPVRRVVFLGDFGEGGRGANEEAGTDHRHADPLGDEVRGAA